MTRVISAPALLIGLGAGLASALLAAAPLGGSMLALPLFVLAPLPLAIAALGWGTPTGLVAGAVALVTVGLGIGWPATLTLALADVAPILIGAHLLGLARTPDPNDPSSREWYPIGRVVMAVTIAISVATIVGGVLIGYDPARLTSEFVADYRAMLAHAGRDGAQLPDAASVELFAGTVIRMTPFVVPAIWLLVIVFDLWAAIRVVAKSGRLARPQEDLAALELPVAATFAFVAALAAAFLAGPIGLAASAVVGALLAAHLLVGLGVLHTLARRSGARIIILAFVYGLILLFTLPMILLSLVGLLEPWVGLRRRAAARRPS